jgi:hypothetical protein
MGFVAVLPVDHDGCWMIGGPDGLRHGFVTYHFATHSNENPTAALAGGQRQLLVATDDN